MLYHQKGNMDWPSNENVKVKIDKSSRVTEHRKSMQKNLKTIIL